MGKPTFNVNPAPIRNTDRETCSAAVRKVAILSSGVIPDDYKQLSSVILEEK